MSEPRPSSAKKARVDSNSYSTEQPANTQKVYIQMDTPALGQVTVPVFATEEQLKGKTLVSSGKAPAVKGAGEPYPASITAKRTVNPIRNIVDQLKVTPNPDKKVIPLSIGDPTTFGNLKTPEVFVNTICKMVRDGTTHGYQHSAGKVEAREAIATHYTSEEAPLTADDVILASGCSGALELVIKGLVNEGDNILVPCPGFALYQTLAESMGAKIKPYSLIAEQDWQVDMKAIRNLVDSKTRAIVVNNPSNPCGSVYSKAHLKEILQFAEECNLPIIADEIYGGLVFKGADFHAMARLTTTVPVLSVGGIAKEFLVPGFRVGWILIHDRLGKLKNVRAGLMSLTQLILGPNSVIQAALPTILTPEKGSAEEKELVDFRRNTIDALQQNALFITDRLSNIEGLQVIVPQGAMYVMVGIFAAKFPFKGDMDFCENLLKEESVFVLPGACFSIPWYFRVVFCAPQEILAEACDRLKAFCDRHRLK